ncbi:GH25 family lysozyme [Micropruina sp.]|uniref:GH25 family lysozyme n=1 Tax=Micropruina sp. TaxID=2737536 RepID=UPI0039E2CA32
MTAAALRAARTLGAAALTLALTGGLLTAVVAAPAKAAATASAKAAAKAKKTTITTQPKSATINRYGTSTSVTLKVKASGTRLKYAWQSRPASGSWKSITKATKSSYRATSSTWATGTRFRVKVKGAKGTVTSKTATLTVRQPSKTPAKDAAKAFGLKGLSQGVDLSSYQYVPSARVKPSVLAEWTGSNGFALLRLGGSGRPINHSYTDACTNAARSTGSTPAVADCAYATLSDQVKAAGLRQGAYWFNGWTTSVDTSPGNLFAGSFTPAKTAKRFAAWLKADGNYSKTSTNPLVIDIEPGGTYTKTAKGKKYTQKLRAWTPAEATRFLTTLKALLIADGYQANLYVYLGASATEQRSQGEYVWSDVADIARLWVASWGTDNGRVPSSLPRVGPWADKGGWSIWQYTSNLRIAGDGVGALDGNLATADAWTPLDD